MKTIVKMLSYIDGKKTTIGVILGALITFALGRGYIAMDVADLLTVILVALGLGANAVNAHVRKKVGAPQK